MIALRQFLTELRRRRVVRVLLIYVVAGWAIVQVAATILPSLHVPAWSITLVVLLVALGLPLAAILGWAYEVSDDGLKRTAPARTEVDTVGALPEASVQPSLASVPATPPVPSVTSTSTRRDAIRHSVAVLPFANLTGDATKDFLGHGLAEELIHALARVPGLRVPARTSSFAYQGRDIDVRRIATELDVGTVLEGSVRAAGEHIRITAQLIDGESGYHLWSQHFDRRFEDLFALQDELASAIVLQTLNVTLQGSGQKSLLRGPPTQNLAAYGHYLEALGELAGQGSPTRSSFDKLQLALKLDPSFAQARATLAQSLSIAIVSGVPLPVSLADAEHEARRALDSDPNSGAIYTALGAIQAAQARWLESEANFQQALTLDAANPWVWHAHAVSVLGNTGHLRALLSHAREGHRLAPAWAGSHMLLAFSSHVLGNDDESRTHVQAACELGMARAGVPLVYVLLLAELRVGRYDAARALIQELLVAMNRSSRELEVLNCVLNAFAGSTSRSAAVAALDGLLAGEGLGRLPNFMRRLLILWYPMLGVHRQAYEVMNGLLDEFGAKGTIGAVWFFLWLPELAAFREDTGFAHIAQRMRLPDYWNKHGPPDGYEWRDGRLIPRDWATLARGSSPVCRILGLRSDKSAREVRRKWLGLSGG